MFIFKKKAAHKKQYDKEKLRQVLKCSICNGEQIAGFKNIHTGKFEEIMLIRGESDLDTFMKIYDIDTVTKEY